MKNSKYLVLGLAAVVCAFVLGRAYTYKYRVQDTVWARRNSPPT